MTTTYHISREQIREKIRRGSYVSCDRCKDWRRSGSSEHGFCMSGGQLRDNTWSHSYCSRFKHKRLTTKEISDRVEEKADRKIMGDVTRTLKQDRKDTVGYIKIVYK